MQRGQLRVAPFPLTDRQFKPMEEIEMTKLTKFLSAAVLSTVLISPVAAAAAATAAQAPGVVATSEDTSIRPFQYGINARSAPD
ncbi:hypothetical protein [Microvirga sp. VF16]|uniref:hypothetical protein n=1 Tax=Microvirga sp. VF16 TaxID=2807101 RepID=UPI00193D3177|nr:hypothetical protein [Microvirga sp. VF16]QRM33894.1 hypothetical protein JO965_38755 [Microvirga sp. VF16]